MIGFFDSGVGGLTVVKAVFKRLPEYQIMYFGDSARTPYGNRSQELIYQFTEQAVSYLFEHGCELVVVACNTASAEALRRIQQEWLPKHYPNRRVLGVIRPVAEEAARVSKFGRIGVVGTRGTINSGAFENEIKKLRPDATVSQQACPLLVPLVEEGWLKRPETNRIIRAYLRALKQKRIDTLVLGCTHYPMLLKQFRAIVGKSVTVLDSSTIVAEKLADYLLRHPEIETTLQKNSQHRFLVTDATPRFAELATKWLGREITLEKITLESK